MSEEKKYYVYIHRKSTDGSVFYVGKGINRRAWSKNRSSYWHRVAKKYGFTVSIISRFSNEKCAFSFERALISFYGKDNLVNMTDGGEGPSGMVHSDEAKERKSKAISGNKHPFWGLFGPDHPRFGKKNSDATRKQMSVSATGIPCKPETREKLRAANLGKVTSRETIEKLKLSNVKPIKTKCGLKFFSIRNAVSWLKETGKEKAQVGPIIHCCMAKRNYKSAYGYVWEYDA